MSDDYPLIEELSDESEHEGKICLLQNLKSVQFNGKRGMTLTWNPEKERMGVKLDNGTCLAVKMENLQLVTGDIEDKPQSPAMLVGVGGKDCRALRPALEALGFLTKTDASAKLRDVESAEIESVIQFLATVSVPAAAVCEACDVLAKVAAGPGKEPLLSENCGLKAALVAMLKHAADAPVQAAALNLLAKLAGTNLMAISAMLGKSDSAVAAAVTAMRLHATDLPVATAAVDLFFELASVGDDQDAGNGDGGRLLGGSSGYLQEVWDCLAQSGVYREIIAAQSQHPHDANLQTKSCQALARVAASGPEGQALVCAAGAAIAAVAAIENNGDDAPVRHAAIFLLANLCAGDDDCKEAVGAAGAPTALATLVTKYRAMADVLRLSIGALAQLAQEDAGRKHVIDSQVTRAVVLGIRAHASDALVCHEACFFIAALAYGGRAGRQACLEAGAQKVLKMVARRFRGKATHDQTVSMANTIVERLEQGKREEGLGGIEAPVDVI